MSDKAEQRLRPCPYCGQAPDINNENTFQATQGSKWGSVVCCHLGPEVRTSYKTVEYWKDDAIEAWNTRPTEDKLVEALEEMIRLVAPGTGTKRMDSLDGRVEWYNKRDVVVDKARQALAEVKS